MVTVNIFMKNNYTFQKKKLEEQLYFVFFKCVSGLTQCST